MKRLVGNPWAILVVLSLGFFMTMLDITIVNIVIPSIIASLHTSLDNVGWVINAYVIVVAVFLITAGRLGDLYGARRIFILGVTIFTLASVACGIAENAWQLIAARVIQGLGTALLLPQTMSMIIATFPPQRRGSALGIWGSVAGLATLTGPTVGGLLVTMASWRWVFLINLPVGILVIAAAVIILPDVKIDRKPALDLPGVLLSWGGLLLLTFGVIEGQRYRWGDIWHWVSIPMILAASVVCLLVFLLYQSRNQHRQPLIPFALFADRNYTLMNVGNVLVAIAMMNTFLPLTIYQQTVLHYTALKAGLVMMPLSLVSMLVAPFSGRLVDRIGGKYILMAGMSLFAVGICTVSFVSAVNTPWYEFLPGLAIAGFGLGCTFGPMQSLATHNVTSRLAGAASGVLNSNRQIGSVLGGPIAIATLQHTLQSQVGILALAAAASLPPAIRYAFVTKLTQASLVGVEPTGVQIEHGLAQGLPATLGAEVARAGQEAFAQAFVMALHATLLVAIASMVAGAVLCLALQPTACHCFAQAPDPCREPVT